MKVKDFFAIVFGIFGAAFVAAIGWYLGGYVGNRILFFIMT